MLMGVKTEMLQVGVSVYSCALAGMGGALYAGLYSLEPSMGALFILKGVEAAILAGVGNLAGALGRRHHSRRDRVDRLALSADRISRRLWAGLPGGHPAVPAERTVREPEMSAAWLLLPLYLVPVVSHSEVLLTILIFTYILGILADRLQHRVRLRRPADDVPRRRLRDRGLRHVSDPHQVRPSVLAGAAADVCRHPGSVAGGGMDLLQVPAARILFCGRDAGLLRARPAGRAELEQRHERDPGPPRARQAHRVAAGRRYHQDRRHAGVVSADADLPLRW